MTTTTAQITITIDGAEVAPFSDELEQEILNLNPRLPDLSRILNKAARGVMADEAPTRYDSKGRPLAVRPMPGSLTYALLTEVFGANALLRAKLAGRTVTTAERDALIEGMVLAMAPYIAVAKSRRRAAEAREAQRVAHAAARDAVEVREKKRDAADDIAYRLEEASSEKRVFDERLASARESGGPTKRIETSIQARATRMNKLTVRFNRGRTELRQLATVANDRIADHRATEAEVQAAELSFEKALRTVATLAA